MKRPLHIYQPWNKCRCFFKTQITSIYWEKMWKRILPFITLLHGILSLLISEPHKFNFLSFRQKREFRKTPRPSKRFWFLISQEAPCWLFLSEKHAITRQMVTIWCNLKTETLVTFVAVLFDLFSYPERYRDARSWETCDCNQRAFHLLSLWPSKWKNTGNRFHSSLSGVPQSFGLNWERVIFKI